MAERVKVLVIVEARAEAASEIEAIIRDLCSESRKDPGCISYQFLRNTADRNGFVIHEEWESIGHLEAHNKTLHVAKAVSAAQPFLARPLDVTRYSTVM